MAKTPELEPHPTLMTDLLVVRHGLTDWNVERRVQGWEPIPINDEGRREARDAGALLGGIALEALVSSPVLRAVQTAEIIAEVAGHEAPIETHPGLGEFRMGRWEKETIFNLRKIGAWTEYIKHPEATTFPEGESMTEIHARAAAAANAIVAEHGGGTIGIVTHGGIARLLTLTAFGMPLSSYHRTHVDNAAICHIRLIPGFAPKVMAVNRTSNPLRTL